MKLPSKFTALVCCVVLIVLAGSGTSLRAQSGGFAYVANANSNNVSAYTIDGTTGALTPVAGSPFPAGSYPSSVTVDPTGPFAYAANACTTTDSASSTNGSTTAPPPPAASPPPPASSPPSSLADPPH